MNEKCVKEYLALSHFLLSSFVLFNVLKFNKSTCFSKIIRKTEYILQHVSGQDIKQLEYES